MSVNAKFQADFSSFLTAIDQAEVALVDFGKGANKVEGSLNRMVDNFSGRKMIQEASLMTNAVEKAGGVAKLTADELETVGTKAAKAAEKMRALGYEVPEGLEKLSKHAKSAGESTNQLSAAWGAFQGILGAVGLQMSIGAVISFGKEILADADALEKLADQTGISVEQLQFLDQAGTDAGVSLESMTGAVSTLQAKVGQGDVGAIGALNALGITVADFKAMDEPFSDIADAISEIEDPIEQARIASELFGTRWKELAPLLKKGMEEARDSASIMSRDTVAFFGAMGDAADGFWKRLKAQAAEAIHEGWLGITFQTAGAQAKVFKDVVDSITMPNIFMEGLPKPGLPEDLDAINKSLDEGLKTSKESTAQWQTWKEAVDKVNISTGHFQTIIDTIPGDVLEAMKAMEQQGASAKDLGVMFGLTNIQIEAFTAMQKNAAAAVDFATGALARQKEIQGLMLKATNERTVELLKARQAEEAWLANNLKAAEAQDTETAAFWKAREAIDSKTEAMGKTTKATGVYMNQLHMLVDDPKLASFFGGNVLANSLYSAGSGGFTPEEAAAMGAGQFINFAMGSMATGWRGFGAAANNVTVNVTQPLGSPDAIARAVGDAMTTRSRAVGARL